MNRLKLPITFIRFITNLFTNRSNQVFTSFGLTDPYNLKVSIDQGEVICPLLWCIYYDPLLTYIQEKIEFGYELLTTEWKHIKNTGDMSMNRILYERIPDTAFIDDTTWIAKSQYDLKQILSIAQSFFRLNDILINNNKATLITNNNSAAGQSIQLNIGTQPIQVKVESQAKTVRILGV